ncbi:hypothetical protein [Bradyrhizobium sp. Ec3.3]|uniref:hypothetical protein n=1 Tax=Bradyrhizobium sp. Ec3.3 TaxID=189753 RepID=UPI0004250AF5|nr:hypothetical protein [Bradyrhizobium sp. Ec3.3]
MAGGDAKIKIKIGEIEIEYEGDASFLKNDLLGIFKELSNTNEHLLVTPKPTREKAHDSHGAKSAGKHSTVTIATLLKAKTGPDLVTVAAAYLHFSQGKSEFTRAEILAAMKTATGYWQKNYTGNLSTSLEGLTKADKLRVVKEGVYSLPADETKRLEAVLAKG